MVASVGRTITVYWGPIGAGSPPTPPQPAVAGIREKSITLSGEAVDITNDDSNGWRELIDAAQTNSVEISCSGVVLNDRLREAWFAGEAIGSGDRMQPASFEYPDGGTITGTFYLQEYSETGNHDGEVTFEATFMSNGPIVYAGSP